MRSRRQRGCRLAPGGGFVRPHCSCVLLCTPWMPSGRPPPLGRAFSLQAARLGCRANEGHRSPGRFFPSRSLWADATPSSETPSATRGAAWRAAIAASGRPLVEPAGSLPRQERIQALGFLNEASSHSAPSVGSVSLLRRRSSIAASALGTSGGYAV